jgi:DnaJ-class molecular chaperone
VACHLPQYQAAKNPDHAAGGFSQDCAPCHTATAWATARFNHDASGFPLTGAHRAATCTQCHGDGVYTGKSTACVSCHQQDYNGTSNPNHGTSGFNTDCTTCHTTVNWTFDHARTPFPLTGAHIAATCQQCHGDGVYVGKPTTCVSCHQANYDATSNPIHSAAGFPTTCQTCHTTSTWAGATFNHTWFPMSHGGARQCSDCHTSSTDYSVFSCTVCHTQSQTDSHHSGVRGYVYNSTNCYSCHRNGGGG